MLATPIFDRPSPLRGLAPQWVVVGKRIASRYCCLTALALWAGSPNPGLAQTDPRAAGSAAAARKAEKEFNDAQAKFKAQTNDAEAASQFARACFDWADATDNNARRAEIAEQGITVSRALVKADAKSLPGHYYLSMNLGELARTKSVGALKLVTQMESEFNLMLGLDANFDFAGPDRNLGLLYRDAPGWPLSLGSKAKAREHLEKALKRAPDYPENHLNLIESELEWGDKKGAIAELQALDKLWPDARKKFTGDAWEASWSDWENRRTDAQKKAGIGPKPKAVTGK